MELTSTNGALNPLLELGLWSAMADGEINDDEIGGLVDAAQDVPGCQGVTADALSAAVDQLLAAYATEDAVSQRIAALAAMITDPTQKQMSYSFAVLFASDDGELSEDEDAFLDGLQDLLGITDADAQAIEQQVAQQIEAQA